MHSRVNSSWFQQGMMIEARPWIVLGVTVDIHHAEGQENQKTDGSALTANERSKTAPTILSLLERHRQPGVSLRPSLGSSHGALSVQGNQQHHVSGTQFTQLAAAITNVPFGRQ